MKGWILKEGDESLNEEKERLAMARTKVTHSTASMTAMELKGKSFSGLISGVENTREEGNNKVTASTPFLNGKVLNVDVAGADGGTAIVDHGDGSLIADMKDSGNKGKITKLRKDRAKIFGGFGGMNSSDELSLGGGSGTGSLKLGFVSNSATDKHEDIAGDGATSTEISSVSSIYVAHELKERRKRKETEIRIQSRLIKGNDRKTRERRITPVEYAPGTCLAKVFTNLFEGNIMLMMG